MRERKRSRADREPREDDRHIRALAAVCSLLVLNRDDLEVLLCPDEVKLVRFLEIGISTDCPGSEKKSTVSSSNESAGRGKAGGTHEMASNWSQRSRKPSSGS